MSQTKKKINEIFRDLDKNEDGYLNRKELKGLFDMMHVTIDDKKFL
jgi:hypothetical protein